MSLITTLRLYEMILWEKKCQKQIKRGHSTSKLTRNKINIQVIAFTKDSIPPLCETYSFSNNISMVFQYYFSRLNANLILSLKHYGHVFSIIRLDTNNKFEGENNKKYIFSINEYKFYYVIWNNITYLQEYLSLNCVLSISEVKSIFFTWQTSPTLIRYSYWEWAFWWLNNTTYKYLKLATC